MVEGEKGVAVLSEFVGGLRVFRMIALGKGINGDDGMRSGEL